MEAESLSNEVELLVKVQVGSNGTCKRVLIAANETCHRVEVATVGKLTITPVYPLIALVVVLYREEHRVGVHHLIVEVVQRT